MANPLNDLFPYSSQQQVAGNAAQQVQLDPQAVESFRRVMNMVGGSSNPNMLSALAQQNPMFSQIMNLCNGRDYKQVFVESCKARGIDPNSIISQLGIK